MKSSIEEAFNKQLNAEFFSSYLYLSMSAWFESQNLAGMAHWMLLQSQEEWQHALKFFDFIHDRDGTVSLTRIDGPESQWDSPLAAFEAALEHERKISELINDLVDLALQKKDHAANTFLQWFVTEQVEEEATALSIVDKLKMIGDNSVVLFMLDNELGQRTLTPAQ